MPKLDGIEMIRKIRASGDNVKIIVVSSVVNSQVTQKVMKLKAFVIKKPIKEKKLFNAMSILSSKI